MRPSWVEVDLDAIRHNVREIAQVVAPALFCAVVKADGYGHGDVPVAEAALDAGADWLAVATVNEGLRLREAGIDVPVLLLSEVSAEDVSTLMAHSLTPTVYSEGLLDALAEAAAEDPVVVHLKVDTGMHRVGVDEKTAGEIALRIIKEDDRLMLGGLWTHFPSAEDDADFTNGQIEQLRRTAPGPDSFLIHVANSAGALLYPEARLDMVRIGLAMYGCYPSVACREIVTLQPAMRVVSQIVHTKRLPAGARPSYGRIRALATESTVATIPIGYADGITRRLGKIGGEVLVGGKRRTYAGIVTMDQIMVDMGDDEVGIGDEVVLLGKQGDEEIDADEWAGLLDTVSWEILCGFGPRLPRRYKG